MAVKSFTEDFDGAVTAVSSHIREILLKLSSDIKNRVYEIRMRANKPLILVTNEGCFFLSIEGKLKSSFSDNSVFCTFEDITETFNKLCCYSVHSHFTGIVKGYITMQGGHRAGISGTAVTDSKGEITSVKDISGISLRLAREVKGCGDKILKEVFGDGLKSVIIAGPPSSGKTTILRDIIRQLSSPELFYKISVVDERQEIACVNSGIAQKDIGLNTDILDCYPKGQAIMQAIKTLSPDIIAIDEVGEESEINNISLGVNSGVKFIVTVHASNFSELVHRPQIARLIETYSFEKLVMLKKAPVGEVEEIYDTGELRDEIIRCSYNMDMHIPCGYDVYA